MVGTRHSLPSLAAEAEDAAPEDAEPPTGMSRKAQAALKKLQIDGKGAMLGERPQHEELETYHFRGAVYAVSKDTKQEWLEAQPERYRRRSGREMESVEAEDSGYGRSSEDVASRQVTPVGSGRRVRFERGGGGGSALRGGGGARKRKRSMSGGVGTEDEGEEEDPRRKKKPRILGARKSAYTPSPPFRTRQAGATFPSVHAPLKHRANIPPRLLQPTAPATANATANTDTSDMVESDRYTFLKLSDHQKSDILRKTTHNLFKIARMNTQYDEVKRNIKKIYLQQRLRELRHGGGNQLSGIPDPRRTYPRPEAPLPTRTGGIEQDHTASNTLQPPIACPPPTSSCNTLPRLSFSLNDHLTNADRAESQIFSARRASTSTSNRKSSSSNTGIVRESRSMRKRRANREMDMVRNLWSPEIVTAVDAEGEMAEEQGSDDKDEGVNMEGSNENMNVEVIDLDDKASDANSLNAEQQQQPAVAAAAAVERTPTPDPIRSHDDSDGRIPTCVCMLKVGGKRPYRFPRCVCCFAGRSPYVYE